MNRAYFWRGDRKETLNLINPFAMRMDANASVLYRCKGKLIGKG